MNFNNRIGREILGIFFLFIVVFSIASLASYNPSDPSIFQNTKVNSAVKNLFGVSGSFFAGTLIFCFGIGAFWVPILFTIITTRLLIEKIDVLVLISIVMGGMLLLITTGSILSIKHDCYSIFNNQFPVGGVFSITLKNSIVKYSNEIGGTFILVLIWIIGFILATSLSIISICNVLKFLVLFLLRSMTMLMPKSIDFPYFGKKPPHKEITNLKTKISMPLNHKNSSTPQKHIYKKTENVTISKQLRYNMPSVDLLDSPEKKHQSENNEELHRQSEILNNKLEDFGVNGKIVAINSGPVVTMFEYKPATGVKINKIANLSDDLALALSATSIRILAPILGRGTVGIEIPNTYREVIRFKEMIVSDSFLHANSNLTLCLGKNIVGNPVSAGLEKMPHLLIAGATGTGKSVALNTIICSLLYKLTPDQVKLILIDPKRIELSSYDGIPHLITPVITNVEQATKALFWATEEMENRYKLLSKEKSKNIDQYNKKIKKEKNHIDDSKDQQLPYIIIIIDEIADLMIVGSRSIETALTRLAQMSRAAGIHLILATQRPSVNILTGIIKANFPTRLTFKVSSKTDSRTIIDNVGAEKLLGNGDMLFMASGTAEIQRIHGAYISEKELIRIIKYVKQQQRPKYNKIVFESQHKKRKNVTNVKTPL